MSAQNPNVEKIINYTETISTTVTNLLIELARSGSAGSHPAPVSDSASNDEIIRRLDIMNLEIASIRNDISIIKSQMNPPASGEEPEAPPQPKIVAERSLADQMELDYHHDDILPVEEVEEYNEHARRYNSGLKSMHDFLAPLQSKSNRPVFGFPETLGQLIKLDPIAETLLCGAFGLQYEGNQYTFATFCGFHRGMLDNIGHHGYWFTGIEIAKERILYRIERARDIAVESGKPLSRRLKEFLALEKNDDARRHNAVADNINYTIMALRDGLNLEVPGFPKQLEWFSTARRKDVLWLLGEYRLDVTEEGCLERFEEFVGVPVSPKREKGEGWYL